MANQVWGKHATVVTGSQDGSKQISKNEWNENLNRKGLLGFDSETIASASSVTIPDDTSDDVSSFIKLSGSTSVDTLVTTNTSEGDLLYLITTGSVTLNNTSSPSSAGDIRLLGDANKDLSTTVPTILMRVGNFWYEYGGSPVTDGSVTNAQLANMAANTIKVRNAVDAGVPSDVAVATTQLLIGNGTGFTAAIVAQMWSAATGGTQTGSDATTTFVSSTKIIATFGAGSIPAAGTATYIQVTQEGLASRFSSAVPSSPDPAGTTTTGQTGTSASAGSHLGT